MEDVFINIDSQYRNIMNTNESESKFIYNMMNMLKNINSVKLSSIEISNSINIVSTQQNNNFFTLHLPNKTNDPSGTIIKLPDGLIQNTEQFKTALNNIFSNLFNSNQYNNPDFAEKYLYIFYLYSNLTITFDFNSNNQPVSLANKLVISKGWTSMYGLVLQINNYITKQYNSRQAYLIQNPNALPINLDNGKFVMYGFSVNVFDRRFQSTNININCTRIDPIDMFDGSLNNLTDNITVLKQKIYLTYIDDTVTFKLETNTPYFGDAILDQLNTNTYKIDFGYKLAGQTLNSNCIYYINNSTNIEDIHRINIYNLIVKTNPECLLLSINNLFVNNDNTPFYYYYVDQQKQTWNNVNNTLDNILNTEYTLKYDIPSFEIDFNTNNNNVNPVNSNILDINKMNYKSMGYYLGYRPINDSFVLSSQINGLMNELTGTKVPNTNGSNYLFLRINDWGLYDFFGKKIFAKILLPHSVENQTYGSYIISNYYINPTFNFRQPQNIKKLDIELLDYLGNSINLNGVDWSFTLQFSEEYNSDNKVSFEHKNLVFKK
jgi:hypothetical protein